MLHLEPSDAREAIEALRTLDTGRLPRKMEPVTRMFVYWVLEHNGLDPQDMLPVTGDCD